MRTTIFLVFGLSLMTLIPPYVNAADPVIVDTENIGITAESEVINFEIPESFRYFDISTLEYSEPPGISIPYEDQVPVESAYAAAVKDLHTRGIFSYMRTNYTIIPEYYTAYYGEPGEENLLYGFVVYRGKEPVPTLEELFERWEKVYEKYYRGKVEVTFTGPNEGTWDTLGIRRPSHIKDKEIEEDICRIVLGGVVEENSLRWPSRSVFTWYTKDKYDVVGPNPVVGAEYFIYREVATEVLGSADVELLNVFECGRGRLSMAFTDGNNIIYVNSGRGFSERVLPSYFRKKTVPERYQENRGMWEELEMSIQKGSLELDLGRGDHNTDMEDFVPDYAQLVADGAINPPDGVDWGCAPISIADFFGYLSDVNGVGAGWRWQYFSQTWEENYGYMFVNKGQTFGEEILGGLDLPTDPEYDYHNMLNSQVDEVIQKWYNEHKFLVYSGIAPDLHPHEARAINFSYVGNGDIEYDGCFAWYENGNFNGCYPWDDYKEDIDAGWPIIVSGWWWDGADWVKPGHSFIAWGYDDAGGKGIVTYAGLDGRELWRQDTWLEVMYSLELDEETYFLQAVYPEAEGGTEPTPIVATVIKTPNENVLSLNAYENFNLENITGLNVYRGNLFNRKLITPEPIHVSPDRKYYWYVDKDGDGRSNYVIEYVYRDGSSYSQVVPD